MSTQHLVWYIGDTQENVKCLSPSPTPTPTIGCDLSKGKKTTISGPVAFPHPTYCLPPLSRPKVIHTIEQRDGFTVEQKKLDALVCEDPFRAWKERWQCIHKVICFSEHLRISLYYSFSY